MLTMKHRLLGSVGVLGSALCLVAALAGCNDVTEASSDEATAGGAGTAATALVGGGGSTAGATAPNGSEGPAGAASTLSCDTSRTAALDFIAAHRSCTTDTDCIMLYSRLTDVSGIACNGGVYLRADSMEALQPLEVDYVAACRPPVTCDSGAAPAVCTENVCVAAKLP